MVSANDSVTLQRLLSSLVFVQKFKFILMKMHKNCCHQSYSFWLRYAPNRLSAGVSLQTPLGSLQHSPRPSSWFRGWGPGEKGKRDEGEKEGGEGKGREGISNVNGSQSSWSDVVSGVPQGTVLGPLLFLLYINDITDNIQPNIRLFADDCIVYRVPYY